MSTINAQIVAVQSVEWLASNQELLQLFLDVTGCNPTDIQDMVENIEFQTSVLDFLMSDDSLLMAFCDVFGIRYDEIAQVRSQLPGGDVPNWS